MRRHAWSRSLSAIAALAGVVSLQLTAVNAQSATSVLFLGNSFTFGFGSAVRFYRAETVTDLNLTNGEGIAGVPALFKSFTAQAGLNYEVSLETSAGAGFEFHLESKRDAISSRSWDKVVMTGQSMLDLAKPGDATKLIVTTRQLADVLRTRNPKVELFLIATWSRADQTYPEKGVWFGKPIDAMARDIRIGNDRAAAEALIKAVIPVGEAWTRAIHKGVADPNPYDGLDAGKVDLWTYDHYHASTAGYYLQALVVFGALTGRDPRSLGEHECSGYELGLQRPLVAAVEQVAFEQLDAAELVSTASPASPKPSAPERCIGQR